MLALAPRAYAQDAQGALVLNDRQTDYEVTSHLYLTRDSKSDFGAREIYQRHRNNLLGERLNTQNVDFSFQPVPHWLVLDIINRSHKSDWIFDFGTLANGRNGLATKLFVMDGARGTILVDTTSGDLSQSSILPLNILPDQTLTLIFYIVPPDHTPFIMAPHIAAATTYLGDTTSDEESLLKSIILTIVSGTAFFFIGSMFLRRGVVFFPHVLFFALQTLWLWLSFGKVNIGIPGGEHLAGITMVGGALLALAITQSILTAQETEAGDSIVLYICASFLVFAVMVFVFFVPQGSYLRLMIAGGGCSLGYLVAAYKSLSIRKNLRWAGLCAGLAFLIMLGAGLLPYLINFGYMPQSNFLMQAPTMIMPLVCILLVLSGVAQLRAGTVSMVREVLRQAQRVQTISNLKQTKENADQARLLRVIEREREIMEDLRTREADRTEEMRMAKITADEANRAKSAFLAVVSHEIRTPMTGIMGMVRLLLDTQMTREQKDFAQTIQDSGDAMLALLNDILDFSKIEGGGMTLETIDFDLHRVIASVTMLMNGHAAQRNLTLETDIDIDTPRFLQGDPTRLRQVLLNLVGNALKFTARGSVTIRLRAGDPKLVPDDKPNLLPIYCAVDDTGIGISEEAQKNLFNPFSQADSSIARKFGGTGLGLAICKRLIETMGSEIELNSIENQGTTFSFTLLLPPGDQSRAQAQGRGGELLGASNLTKPMDILVIDDNPVNCKVMSGLLSRDGHRVTTAASGPEGLIKLAASPFKIVFLDIEMPGMNGFEVMKEILAHNDIRVNKTPVIALTGNISDADLLSYKNAGMNDTVIKPIDPERLRDILLRFGEAQQVSDDQQPQGKNDNFELSHDDLDEDSFAQSVEIAKHETRPLADATQGYVPMPPEDSAHTPTSTALNDTLFDTKIVTSLKDSLGTTPFNEMLEGVFAHNNVVMPTLQQAFADTDWETLRGCAHELKGMNGNFGLKAIADYCTTIERAARHGDIPQDVLARIVTIDLPKALADTQAAFEAQ